MTRPNKSETHELDLTRPVQTRSGKKISAARFENEKSEWPIIYAAVGKFREFTCRLNGSYSPASAYIDDNDLVNVPEGSDGCMIDLSAMPPELREACGVPPLGSNVAPASQYAPEPEEAAAAEVPAQPVPQEVQAEAPPAPEETPPEPVKPLTIGGLEDRLCRESARELERKFSVAIRDLKELVGPYRFSEDSRTWFAERLKKIDMKSGSWTDAIDLEGNSETWAESVPDCVRRDLLKYAAGEFLKRVEQIGDLANEARDLAGRGE